MAYTKTQFTSDFEAAQQAGLAYHGMAGVLDSIPSSQAWDLYQKTLNAPLRMQIFGRHIFDQNEQVVKFANSVPAGSSAKMPEFMVGITQTEIDNFGATNANSSGSALLTGRNDWNLTINDVWLCAGVHSLQQFHPASPLTHNNIYSKKHILTITGRELVGLVMAGYVPVSGHRDLGTVWRPSITKKVDDLNLVNYQVTIASLKTEADAKSFFASRGLNNLHNLPVV